MLDKQKKKMKELEEENESLHDKYHALKSEYGRLESDILLMDNKGTGQINDFEKQKLRLKLQELTDKLHKSKEKKRLLDKENNFYNQTTTVFLTIKKVIEKEKKYCFMMA
jgi:archaellum component FlaC